MQIDSEFWDQFSIQYLFLQSIAATALGAPAISDGKYNPNQYKQNAGM